MVCFNDLDKCDNFNQDFNEFLSFPVKMNRLGCFQKFLNINIRRFYRSQSATHGILRKQENQGQLKGELLLFFIVFILDVFCVFYLKFYVFIFLCILLRINCFICQLFLLHNFFSLFYFFSLVFFSKKLIWFSLSSCSGSWLIGFLKIYIIF